MLEVVVSELLWTSLEEQIATSVQLTFLKNDHIGLELTLSFRFFRRIRRNENVFLFVKFVIAIGKAEIDERSIRVSDAILLRTRDDPGRTRDFRERLEVGCDASGVPWTDPLEPALSTSIRHASSPADNRCCTAG